MREKLLTVGGAIGLTLGGGVACTPPESEYIKGTVVVLKGPDGNLFDVYVWPRVEKKAVVGQPIKIDPRYGSLTDNNNQVSIINKTPVKEK